MRAASQVHFKHSIWKAPSSWTAEPVIQLAACLLLMQLKPSVSALSHRQTSKKGALLLPLWNLRAAQFTDQNVRS